MVSRVGDRIATVDDRIAICSAAFVQGAVLAVFAAFTAIFIEKYHYALTLPEYGTLFVPLVLALVVVTLFSSGVGCRFRAQHAYVAGLGCSLVGMALLVATEWAERLAVSYPLLLASTAFVGAGAGLTFPFLRCYAISRRPLDGRRQIILANALLAAGMAAAPVYVLLTERTSAWWSLPPLLGVLLIAEMLLGRSLRAPPYGPPVRRIGRGVSLGFRVYPVLALVYGICIVYIVTVPHHVTGSTSHIRLTMLVLAEAAFWPALVEGCRVVFALIDGMRSRRYLASIAVYLIAFAILLMSLFAARYDIMHLGIYLLAGIACAALLPIDTRPGNEQIAVLPIAVASGLIALFPVGLGLSRYAYDIVMRQGLTSFQIFISMALVGASACLLLLPIIRRWHTMAYFDEPSWRRAELRALAESALPRQRERSQAEQEGPERGGVTARSDDEQRGSRRQRH